ncbi:hypothetical protein G3I76_40260, partial [Streptomyces sp. SID11233]|nr:hypothetical protein [Streptomyces sp. SID11233]
DTAKFDLSFDFVEQGEGGGIQGWIEYSADLFDASTAALLGERLVSLLEQAAAAPHRPLTALDVLREDERARVLTEWNATEAAAQDAPLPEAFRAQAARTPGATALVF